MHSENQIERALLEYRRRKSVTAGIRYLGYPSKSALYRWIQKQESENSMPSQQHSIRKTLCVNKTAVHHH